MKTKFNYKSKRLVVIIIALIVLLAGVSVGAYFFTRGNTDAEAAAGNETTQNNVVSIEDGQITTPSENGENGEQTEENIQNTTPNNEGTTTATTGNIPNEEYVTERIEEQERVVSQEDLVGWEAIELSAVASVADYNLNKANLIISKTADKTEVLKGDIIEYTITVVNNSEEEARNINITDAIPEGTVRVNENGEEIGTDKVIIKVNIGAGEAIEVKIKVKVTATTGIISNVAIVDGTPTNKVEIPIKATYIVEYYVDGKIILDETVQGSIVEIGTQVTEIKDKMPIGYRLDNENTTKLPFTVTENNENNVIKVYYTKRADLSYTVNYLEKDTNTVLATAKTVEGKTFKEEVTETAIEIAGYNKVAPESKTITIKVEGNVINFYYTKRADLSYTVNYLEKDTNTVLATAKTVEGKTFKEEVTETAIEIAGYNKVAPESKTITIEVENNVINFYYTKRADLSYTVNYLEKDTNTVLATAKTVGNQTFKDEINSEDEKITITGYKFDSVNPETLVIAESQNIINLYYVKDETQTKELTYTVKYFKGEEEVTKDEIRVTKTVWVNDANTIKVEAFDKSNDRYEGYKFANTNPGTIPVKVQSGTVIKVHYVKDEEQTKQLTYTVKYFIDGKEVEEDRIVEKETVWIGAPDTLILKEFDKSNDRYIGYKYLGTNPVKLTPRVDNGTIIEVYYVKDEEQTKTIFYKVEYYKDNVKAEEIVITETVWINAEDKLTVKPVDTSDDRYSKEGYKFEKSDVIPNVIVAGGVIKVYYSKPIITVQKSATSKVDANSDITYKITLTNSGKVNGETTVTDTLPEGVILKQSTLADGAIYNEKTRTITWSNISVSKNNGTKVLTFKATVNGNKIGETITNNVGISNGNTDTAITEVNEKTVQVVEMIEGKKNTTDSNIVLVLDLSSSMNWSIYNDEQETAKYEERRLTAAKNAITTFINSFFADGQNANSTISVITFNNNDNSNVLKFNGNEYATASNYSSLVTAVNNISIGDYSSGYGTYMKPALQKTYDTIYGKDNGWWGHKDGISEIYPNNKNVVIFLSDGKPSDESWGKTDYSGVNSKATTIKNAGASFYSIGFGPIYATTPDPVQENTPYWLLKQMSSNNKVYQASDTNTLVKQFKDILAEENGKTNLITGTFNSSDIGNGILKIQMSKTLTINNENALVIKHNGTEIVKCTDVSQLSSYNIIYDEANKTLTWDINAFITNSDDITALDGKVEFIYYISR